ncbi:MAG TPA: hypothetical protein DCG47_08355 [Spirochaetaceae bacterium]|jgi:hypothetical protein|nr:hypothetical protein [Spirochaetaceae bacterium]
MVKHAERTGRVRGNATARVATLFALSLIVIASAGAQDGMSWRSYAELGGGISVSGGDIRPLVAIESGLFLGAVELGSYVHLLPLEFGSPDLLQAAAVAYGGSVGYSLDTGNDTVKPFGRIGLGGIYKAEADDEGAFSGMGAERKFACVFTLGVELPLSERWSARLWGAYRLTDNALDFDGKPLSGFDLGASIRAHWTTTVR